MNTTSLSSQKTSKGLNIALWVVQILLAAMFIMVGFMKVVTPIEKLGAQMSWVKDMPGLIRFIGIAELLGGLGLLLPALTRVKPVLTPVAAMGLALIMIFAAVFHISRGETPSIGINLIICALAVFVAWGRFKKVPIQPR